MNTSQFLIGEFFFNLIDHKFDHETTKRKENICLIKAMISELRGKKYFYFCIRF